MGLSRKRQRELNQLKSHAEDLWDGQREVLEHANRVVREARRQAANYAREEVSPRVRETLDERVRPAVASGLSATRHAASSARERLVDDVFPAVSSALGSALALLEVAKDPQVRATLKRVSSTGVRAGTRAAARVGIPTPKPSAGPGRYILIGIGVVALAGVAYAAWQTLRADDDLWIDDEELTEQSGDIRSS
jgi:hypothetical protein